MRSGTEAVELILGLQGALESLPEPKQQEERQTALWEYARQSLLATGFAAINSPPCASPYILNISVPGYRSETLLHFLESRGVYVSSGSACAKGRGSYVLREMGLADERVDSALRISFSRESTPEDIDRLCAALGEAGKSLRKAVK